MTSHHQVDQIGKFCVQIKTMMARFRNTCTMYHMKFNKSFIKAQIKQYYYLRKFLPKKCFCILDVEGVEGAEVKPAVLDSLFLPTGLLTSA